MCGEKCFSPFPSFSPANDRMGKMERKKLHVDIYDGLGGTEKEIRENGRKEKEGSLS